MRIVQDVVRYLVGGLFIFSGLVKVNDPVGTAIKLGEYFDVFAADIASFFEVFEPYALPIAILLNVVEVVLGVALIFRWKVNITMNLLAIIIVFFTFLTFYSAYFNKVTDCGCFGDAIKLTPWESFTKDVILLILIGFLYITKSSIKESTLGVKHVIIICTTGISFLLCIYAVRHLPFIDFRAYKVGVHIPTDMEPAESAIFEYTFKKDGEIVKSDKYLKPEDGYEYVDYQVINEDAITPKITDFALWNEQGDQTQQLMQGTYLWIVTYNMAEADVEGLVDTKNLTDRLEPTINPIILTASSDEEVNEIKALRGLNMPFYHGDATVLKTIIRSNPGLVLVKDGVILGKWHFNDVPSPVDIADLVKK